MGTNFFARKPARKERLKEMGEAIDKNKWYDVEILAAAIRSETEIHLGKRSYGWQFLWDLHGCRYYEPTLASIYKFLDDPEVVIVDEYCDGCEEEERREHVYTVKQFFDAITLYEDEKHDNLKSYKAREEFADMTQRPYERNGKRLGTVYDGHELITDNGLRFSLYEDFA